MANARSCLRCGLGCAALVLASALPSPAQKGPDTRVNASAPAAAPREFPRIAASGSTVYVTWADRGSSHDVYLNRSADGGATWLPADVRVNAVTGPFSVWEPRMAVSGSVVYVTWGRTRFTTDVYFNRSLDGGATWLRDDVRVDTAGPINADANFPAIAAAGSDVYVVWEDDRLGGFRAADIHFNRSLDGGITWLPSDIRLSTGAAPSAAESADPVVVASGSAVYVTWQEWPQSSSLQDVWFTRSLDKGLTWIEPVLWAPRSGFPQIAASGSSVYLVWDDSRNGKADIYFNRSLDRGATWLPSDIRLDTDPPGAADSRGPKIAVSGSSVYVAWEDRRHSGVSTKTDVYFNRSLDGGVTWRASDIRLNTDSPGASRSKDQQIDAVGSSVFVTWADLRNGGVSTGSDIYFNRSLDGGTTWLASDVRLDTDPPGGSESLTPQIAAAGASAHVAWVDWRNWNGVGSFKSDIYFNIPFGFQPYGTPTPGSGGLPPALSGAGSATIGSTPSIDVTGGLGGAAGALFLGVGPASKVSIPVLGGTILVQPALGLPLVLGGAAGVPGAGAASLPLPLPNLPSAVGVNLNFQGVFLDAGAVLGISMTNAIEMWIG